MINRDSRGTVAASAGTGSTTIFATDSNLNTIKVVSTTGSTEFDVKLTDRNSVVVYHQKDITGELSDKPNMDCYGSFTLTIENSSADETFTYYFMFHEH